MASGLSFSRAAMFCHRIDAERQCCQFLRFQLTVEELLLAILEPV